MSSWELLSKAIDVVEIAVRFILALLVEFVVVEFFIVEFSNGRCSWFRPAVGVGLCWCDFARSTRRDYKCQYSARAS